MGTSHQGYGLPPQLETVDLLKTRFWKSQERSVFFCSNPDCRFSTGIKLAPARAGGQTR